MNCKPGDLAAIVRCDVVPECVGRIVECLKFHGEQLINGQPYPDVWEIRWGDNDARKMTQYAAFGMRDSWMRPIRNQGGEDETLTWAGKPEQVAA